MTHVVTTPAYQGPIETLLQLITAHEIDVLDVPLRPIVDEFVAELRARAHAISADELSEFLLVAAILLELKSGRLLPGADAEPDEEFVGWEERDVLLARLLELRAYAAAADAFVSLFERAARSLPRAAGLNEGFEVHPPDLLGGVTVADVAAAYLRGIAERPAPVVRLHHVTVDAVTVAETVRQLAARLPGAGRLTLRELTAGLTERIEIIVHFLAVLELCKTGHVRLGQGETFGDVEIEWVAGDREVELGLVDIYAG